MTLSASCMCSLSSNYMHNVHAPFFSSRIGIMSTTSEGVDRIEDHGMAVDGGKGGRVRCNYCGKEVRGFNRLKHHLGAVGSDVSACIGVPSDIKEHMKKSLLDKKKERLLKEVGDLYHPDLPLKRNFVPATSEVRHCLPKQTHPSTSTDDSKVEERSDCHPNLAQPSTSQTGKNIAAERAPMEVANGSVPVSCMTENLDTVVKNEVKDDSALFAARCVGRFFYEAGIDLTGVKLPSFQGMVDAVINCGVGYKAPRYDELKGWILQEELQQVSEHVEVFKRSWVRTGCSIMLDGWTDQRGRSMMGFLVNCPQGTIFLRSVDASDALQDVDALFLLLCKVIEEVGIQNVVQVIAHETSCYMEAAGKKLVERYKTIFWTLCADYCVALILEKVGMMDHVKKALTEAKAITRFIYSHALPLELMRRHIRGRDLVRTSKLKSVTPFITLERMVSEKQNLLDMFSSPTWNSSIWALRTKGKNICELVKNLSFWGAAEDVLRITNPLVAVLHQINGGDKAPMGFLYDAMDRAKEAIKINLGGEEAKYLPIWTIIDEVWDNYLHSPLHSAGYYLNPGLFYSTDFFVDAEVANGLLFCIVRMVEDQPNQELIVQQLDAYRAAIGGFGEQMAIAQRNKTPPVLWWSQHGGQSPELQRLAIRILSQTCSGASRYNNKKLRYGGICEQLHSKRSNGIEQQRFCDLEFVRNNLELWHSDPKEDSISIQVIDPMDDWIVEG